MHSRFLVLSVAFFLGTAAWADEGHVRVDVGTEEISGGSSLEEDLIARCRVSQHLFSASKAETMARRLWSLEQENSRDLSEQVNLLNQISGMGYQKYKSEHLGFAELLEFFRDREKRGFQDFDTAWKLPAASDACERVVMLSRPSYKIDAVFLKNFLAALPMVSKTVFGDETLLSYEKVATKLWGSAALTPDRSASEKMALKLRGLTRAEADALYVYAALGYREINSTLNEGNPAVLKSMEPVFQSLDGALAKLEKNIYRGEVSRTSGPWPARVDAEHRVGNIVTYPAYTSTSMGNGGSGLAKVPVKYELTIKSLTGRKVQDFVMNHYEREVLIPRGAKFKVISRTKVGAITRIRLEQIE